MDKHGKLVTRHVLSSANTTARVLPSVSTPPSMAKQSLEFQKLTPFWKYLKNDEMEALYPVAHIIAAALEKSGKESFFDLIIAADTQDPEWVDSLVAVSHFINRGSAVRDAEVTGIALSYIATANSLQHSYDLVVQDEGTQSKVDETLSIIENSDFARALVGHYGSSGYANQQAAVINYLWSKVSDGDTADTVGAFTDLKGFIDFADDQHEEKDLIENLKYVDLIEYVAYAKEKTNASPDHALQLVKNQRYNVAAAKEILDDYDGAPVLIDGTL